MHTRFDLGCETRDGVRLSADVYLPDSAAPVPAILTRTPYDNTSDYFVAWARFFADHGYAFVVQDVRGRGDSDGLFTAWADDFDDGYDSVEWVAAQPWCDGRVGMVGGSYGAWVQWTAAARRPPHLVTLITSGSPGRWFRDWPYRFGALWAEDYLEWVNRVSGRSYQPAELVDWSVVHARRRPRAMDQVLGRPMPHWQECLDHCTFDEFWQRLQITGYEAMDLPALHITGWYDACAPGEFHHYHEMIARSPAAALQSLLVGAWDHRGACLNGQAVPGILDLGPEASLDLPAVWLAWFDRWLMAYPGAVEVWPPVRYFAMGENRWREADAWPPADATATPFFLHADGAIGPTPPSASGTRSYRYDPADPTLALPALVSAPLPEWSPRDINFLAARPDVLIYTSEPFASPMEIAGPVVLSVDAASDAVDTDFAFLLADVAPGGRAALLSHGIVRAAFRDSLEQPRPLAPGAPYRFRVEGNDLGHVFLPGHRLQLVVCSSLFPYYHPNPNTGALYGDEDETVPATQTIFHGSSSLHVYIRPDERG